MPYDLSCVDLADLIESKAPVRFGKAQGRAEKRTRKAACPMCGGADRFAVFIGADRQHFYCGIHGNGCKWHGDAIDFLRDYCAMTWPEICEELNLEPGQYTVSAPRKNKRGVAIDQGPCAKWIEAAADLVERAHIYLLSAPGAAHARDYLLARAITLETIKAAKLGYAPKWVKQNRALWGLDEQEEVSWIAEGVIIPSYVDSVLWHLDTRRLTRRPGETEEDFSKYRYHEISGSTMCLYNVDAIAPGRPVILTEGRIDALSAWQECRDLAACVATGSTGDSTGAQWAMRLALASHVLIAFDDDTGGVKGAREWLPVLPSAEYWAPYEHDVNAMLAAGHDLREWCTTGLELLFGASVPDQAGKSDCELLPDDQEDNAPFLCSVCGLDAKDAPYEYLYIIDPDTETVFCSEDCQAKASRAHRVQVATLKGRIDTLIEGHRPAEDSRVDRASILARISDIIGPCTITPGRPERPPYTPVTLPPLERAQCAFIVATERKAGTTREMIGKPCQGKPVYHGWCEAHKYSHDLLALGAKIGFPALQLNAYRGVGRGVARWEAYAERAPARWIEAHDLAVIRRQEQKMIGRQVITV